MPFTEVVHVEEISLKYSDQTPAERLPCSAVFVFIGAEPAAEWLPAEIARDANGYLLTGTDAVGSGYGAAPIAILARWKRRSRVCWPRRHSFGLDKHVGFAVGDGSLAVTCTTVYCRSSDNDAGDREVPTHAIQGVGWY